MCCLVVELSNFLLKASGVFNVYEDIMMKVLFTGGTGFIGSALTRSLTEQGFDVTILSRNPGAVEKICGSGVTALIISISLSRRTPIMSLSTLLVRRFLMPVGAMPVKRLSGIVGSTLLNSWSPA